MIILKEMSQDREELPPKVSLKSTLELPIDLTTFKSQTPGRLLGTPRLHPTRVV